MRGHGLMARRTHPGGFDRTPASQRASHCISQISGSKRSQVVALLRRRWRRDNDGDMTEKANDGEEQAPGSGGPVAEPAERPSRQSCCFFLRLKQRLLCFGCTLLEPTDPAGIFFSVFFVFFFGRKRHSPGLAGLCHGYVLSISPAAYILR